MGTNYYRSLILLKTNPPKPPKTFIIFISSHPFNLFLHIHAFYNVPLCSEASPHKLYSAKCCLYQASGLLQKTGWKSGNQGAAVQSFCQEIKKCKRVPSSCTSQLFSLFLKPRFHLLFTRYSWSYDREASARMWWQVIIDPVSLGSLEVCGEAAAPSLAICLGGCIPLWDVWPKAALSWLADGSCDRGKLRRCSRISYA